MALGITPFLEQPSRREERVDAEPSGEQHEYVVTTAKVIE
jgi:hypothetical protein